MIRKCPMDKSVLQQMRTEGHYGYTIIVDQCSLCQGIWFDQLEPFLIREEKAHELHKVSISVRRNIKNRTNLVCPNDGHNLIHYVDLNFPKDVDIESCTRCGGYWFDAGELIKLKQIMNARKKVKAKTIAEKQLEQSIEAILQIKSKKATYEQIGKVGMALNAPLSRIALEVVPPVWYLLFKGAYETYKVFGENVGEKNYDVVAEKILRDIETKKIKN